MNLTPRILPLLVASAVGFLVPLLWFVVGMVLFGGAAPLLAQVLWWLVHLTCPFWSMPGPVAPLVMPVLNAGLYAAVCALVRGVTGRSQESGAIRPAETKAQGIVTNRTIAVRIRREPWWFAACVAAGITLSLLDAPEGLRPELVSMTESIAGLIVGGLVLSPFVYFLVVLARLMFWALVTKSAPR